MKQSLKLTLVCVTALTVTASPLLALVPAGAPAQLTSADEKKAVATDTIPLAISGMT